MPRHSTELREKSLPVCLNVYHNAYGKLDSYSIYLWCLFFMILGTTHAYCGKHENME